MKPAFALGLRGRLLLLLLAAFAILIGILVYIVFTQRAEDIDNARMHLVHASEKIAAEQNQIVAYADQYLLGLMRIPQVREIATKLAQLKSAPEEECSRFLTGTLKEAPGFVNAGVVTLNGDVLCNALQPKFPINIADRLYFQEALKARELVISDVVVGRANNTSTINFARALRDDTESVRGVVWTSLDLAWVSKEFAKAALPEGGRVGLFDANGTIVARYPDPEGLIGKDASGTPFFKSLVAKGGKGTVEELGLDGIPRIYAFTPFANTVGGRIVLWVSIPKDVITAHVEREFAWTLVISTALLLLTIGAVWVGGERMLLHPVAVLSDAARRLAQGNLNARTDLRHTDDVLGRLARSFDDMAEAIESKHKQLGRANRALRVLTSGNRALLRAKDEQSLVEDMCGAIVEAGDYRIAWVAYAEKDRGKSVRTVAVRGAERDFLDGLKITWDETDSGRGPNGAAIRRGIPVVSNDIAADPDFAPWRELAQRHGFASALVLPLQMDGAIIGALCICAAEPGAFDEEAVELLSEAADDLAFGIAVKRAEVEHDRTQAALRTAEDRFRAAAEANLDALFILGSVRDNNSEIVDFEFIDLNPSAEKMLGMAREQVIGQKLCELIPINRTGGFFDRYVAVVTTGAPLEEEFPIDTPQIKAKWLRHQVVRVGDGIAISSRDISEWKTAGERIRQAELRYRTLFEQAPVGVVIIDDDTGLAVECNDVAHRQLGYSREEFVHLRVSDYAAGASVEEIKARAAEILREGHGKFDALHRTKGGELRNVLVEIRVLTLGGRRYFYCIYQDVTERQRAEVAIRRANRALRTLSAGNEALVRATNEEELLQSVARVIVEQGGYRLATVGFAADDLEKSIAPVAWSGVEEGYYSQERPTWADTEKGQVPIARAIRTGTPQICRDIARDPGFAPWRESALARGYGSNIVLPLSDGARTFGGLSIYSSETGAFDEEETRLLAELANDLAFGIVSLRTRAERDRIAHAHAHHAEILQKSLEQSIQAIAATVEARDPYTAGHQRRVGELAVAIAQELGLPEDKVHGVHLAAVVHDLGKIRVPADILSKPGKLSDLEFMLVKEHAQAGYDILKDVNFPWPIADIVRQHHEKLDGQGYPQGLKGAQILLESRIMTVADVVEAMASHRPYRAALGVEVALKEIERGRGSAYDPAVADACLKLFREGRFAFQG